MVPTNEVANIWGEILPLLDQATSLSGGRYSNISVLDDALSGRITVWIVVNKEKISSVFTVRIVDYPSRRALQVELLAGSKFRQWSKQMFNLMNSYAKSHNCTHLETGGRDGWERLGRKYGFKKAYTIIDREVE